MEISKQNSYDFVWELGKRMAMPHVQRRSLNGLKSSVQWKMKMFLGTAFEVEEPLLKVEQQHKCPRKRRRCKIHMMNCKIRKKKIWYQNPQNNANHVEKVFVALIL